MLRVGGENGERREEGKKKFGKLVCRPSWEEREIKEINKCEWKKMEGEISHAKAKNNMEVFILNWKKKKKNCLNDDKNALSNVYRRLWFKLIYIIPTKDNII